MASDNNDATVNRLRDIAMHQPEIAQAHVSLLEALAAANRLGEVRQYLVEMVSRYRDWPQLHFDVVRWNPRLLGQACDEGSRQENDDAILCYLRGMIAQLLSPKEALSEFQEALRLDPSLAAAYFHSGISYHQLRLLDRENSEQYLERSYEMARRAIAVNPGMAEPYFLLGTLLLMSGRSAEALENFSAFISRAGLHLANYVRAAEITLATTPVTTGEQERKK